MFGKSPVIDTFESLLYRYLQHPEAKSLAPDGTPCKGDTRGLLQRAHIIAGQHRRIGKESDRRWEAGDDFESLQRRPIEYTLTGMNDETMGQSQPNETLVRKIRNIGIRELMRAGLSRRILQKFCRREFISDSNLQEYEARIGNLAN
jgi:hypothetical protein